MRHSIIFSLFLAASSCTKAETPKTPEVSQKVAPTPAENLPAPFTEEEARQLTKAATGEILLRSPETATRLSPGSASIIAAWQGGGLELSSLRHLDAPTAEALIQWKSNSTFGGVLALNGLLELDAATAEKLAQWSDARSTLSLDGLTQLNENTAAALAMWGGSELSLLGLRELSVASASALARWKGGSLNFSKLTLSDEAKEALSAFKGQLSIR